MSTVAERTGIEGIDIYDPDRYVESPQHEVFERLRREAPVYWQDMPDGTGYWAVLKHADVVAVSREPLLFSASLGGVVLEDQEPERLEMMRNMLLAMDPPRHVDWRRNISPAFKARIIAGMEDRIREICRGIMARAAEQGEVEYVHDVTSSLPTQIVGQLMGLPEEDWAQLHEWAELSTSGQDPDINPEGYKNPGQGAMHMVMYAMEWAAKRRELPPQEDLTTLILEAEVGGRTMTDIEFGSFFNQLVTAGNDTTKTMLASGLQALLLYPEQLQALRDDPGRIPGAIEEILRWVNPLHYFRRTATQDTEIRGVRIAAGEKLAMMYTSANRDEDVFADPHAFDISRNPNPHLSFGIGEHFCLGAHLARLEGRVFFEELLATFPRIEQTGPAVRIRSNLNNALKRLPIRLER